MKFIISSAELGKALETVCSGIVWEKKVQTDWLCWNLQRAANNFLRENRKRFKSDADLKNYAQDLNNRADGYFNALEEFLQQDLFSTFYFSKDDKEYFPEPLWRATEDKIRSAVADLLVDVFVRNEVTNFDTIVQRILKKRNWKAFASLHGLSATAPEAHPHAVKLLHTLVSGLEAQFASWEEQEETRHYLGSLLCLLMHMRKIVENILEALQQKTFTEKQDFTPHTDSMSLEVSGNHYPAWVFSSGDAYAKFVNIHQQFCKSVSDIAYLYRSLSMESLIVVGISSFQQWYNNWSSRLMECWQQFKTMDRLAVPKRVQMYDLVLQQCGYAA